MEPVDKILNNCFINHPVFVIQVRHALLSRVTNMPTFTRYQLEEVIQHHVVAAVLCSVRILVMVKWSTAKTANTIFLETKLDTRCQIALVSVRFDI